MSEAEKVITALQNPALYDEAVLMAENREAVALIERQAAEIKRLGRERSAILSIISRCYECDLPLLHDDSSPDLAWWCAGCGMITTVPDTIRAAIDALPRGGAA